MSLPAAGRRDRRIVVERLTVMQGSTGAAVESWSTLATLWAEARLPTGREAELAGQVAATVDRVFVVLWRDDIEPKQRIRFDGQVYDVVSVAEMGRREGLTIGATVRKVA